MLKFLGRVLFCLLPLSAVANTDVFVGADVHHRAGGAYLTVERSDMHLGMLYARQHDHPPTTIAVAGYEPFKVWRINIGAAYLSDTTEISGTRLNFSLSTRYELSKRASIMLRHYSHGRVFGIEKDKANSGWNILGLRYQF